MIGELLSAGVAWAECFGDRPDAVVFPEEEAAVARAAEGRRREFATARACARQALSRLGYPPGPLPASRRGAPDWPAGTVGSITHCRGYRAAAVARDSALASLGIDAEPNAPLHGQMLTAVAFGDELHEVRRLSGAHSEVCWDRLLFSAKESAYKAWYPLARARPDFDDADSWLSFGQMTVTVQVEQPVAPVASGTFCARPVEGLEPSTRPAFHGRWLAGGGLLLTAVAVGPPPVAVVEQTPGADTGAPAVRQAASLDG